MAHWRQSACAKWTAVLGAFLLNMTTGTFWFWGNMYVYATSYLLRHQSSSSGVLSQWTVSAYAFSVAFWVILGGILRKFIGKTGVMVLGTFLEVMGTALSFFSINHSVVAFTFTYGVTQGSGSGLLTAAILECLSELTDANIGKLMGLVFIAPNIGALLMNEIITVYINPNEELTNIAFRGLSFFSQESLLVRVPYVFLIMATIYLVLNISGSLLLIKRKDDYDLDLGLSVAHKTGSDNCKRFGTFDQTCDVNVTITNADITPQTDPFLMTSNERRDPIRCSVESHQQEHFPFDKTQTSTKTTEYSPVIDSIESVTSGSNTTIQISKETNRKSYSKFSHDNSSPYLDQNSQENAIQQSNKQFQSDQHNHSMLQMKEIEDETKKRHTEKDIESSSLENGREKFRNENSKILKQNSNSSVKRVGRDDFSTFDMLKTKEFYMVTLAYVSSEVSTFVISNYYKIYGQIYLSGDQFFTTTGSLAIVAVMCGKMIWGYLLDRVGPKNTLVSMFSSIVLMIYLFFFGPMVNKYFYVFTVVLAETCCTMYGLYSAVLSKMFGNTHIANNVGVMTLVSCVPVLFFPALANYITDTFGWFALCSSVSVFSFLVLCLIIVMFPR